MEIATFTLYTEVEVARLAGAMISRAYPRLLRYKYNKYGFWTNTAA